MRSTLFPMLKVGDTVQFTENTGRFHLGETLKIRSLDRASETIGGVHSELGEVHIAPCKHKFLKIRLNE